MVMDQQVRTLWDWLGKEASLAFSAAKAGMDRKTARKYRSATRLPSQMSEQAPARIWRTREDPFADVWSEVEALLKEGPGWEAKTLFEELQRRYPDQFARVNCARCSGGSNTGRPRAGRTRRFSSRSIIDPADWARRTSPT
jgi:hypothetical protein